jgi:hypothetical protein
MPERRYYVWFDFVNLPRERDADAEPVGRIRRFYRGDPILLGEEQAARLLKLGAVGEEPPPPRGAAPPRRTPEEAGAAAERAQAHGAA